MSDEDTLRSAEAATGRPILPPEVFSRIYRLGLSCPWTRTKVEALTHLLCHELSHFDQIELVCEILERFLVVNSSAMAELAGQTAEHLVSQWGFVPNRHRIVAVSDSAEVDGSHQFLLALRTALMARGGNWKDSNFVSDIASAAALARKGYTFLLLDDFIGTGNKIRRKANWFAERTQGKQPMTIYIGAIAAMERSRPVLEALEHKYFVPIWLKRAITDHERPENVVTKTQLMRQIENVLQRKLNGRHLSQFSLGYGQSEAAFWIEPMNVPNNVFPIFWWKKDRSKQWRRTVFVGS